MKFVLIALIAASMTGCATMAGNYIESDITAYHDLPPHTSPMKVLILPWREEQSGSLEFRTFSRYVAAALTARGHEVVADPERADHLLFFDYGIDDGTLVTSTYSVPQFGVTGYSGSITTGTVSTIGNTSYINANTTATPTYGITGYHTGVASQQVFKRFVAVDILEVNEALEPQKVYEAKLLSDGRCRNVGMLMPKFVDAIFADFPGTSGATRNVVAPWDGNC